MPNSSIESRGKNWFAFAILFLAISILFGCGDVYRPVANPIVPPGGDPQPLGVAAVLNSNGGGVGSVSRIDVSGDTNLGNNTVGANPTTEAISPGLGWVFVINKGASTGDSTISQFSATTSPATGINSFSFSLQQDPTNPVDLNPVFIWANSTTAYVAEQAVNKIAIINNGFHSVSGFVPVGLSPVAVVATPDGRKAYSINAGDSTISVIETADDVVAKTIYNIGSGPTAVAMQTDGQFFFVANQDGTVTQVSTVTDSVVNTLHVGTNPTQVVWDNNLKRIYVVNSGSNTISIFDSNTVNNVNQPPPLATVPAQGVNPIAVAPLSDGSKFYVLNAGSNTVTVFDAKSYALRNTIATGSNPVSLGASASATKVYIVNKGTNTTTDMGSVQIVKTIDDSIELTVAATSLTANPIQVVVQ